MLRVARRAGGVVARAELLASGCTDRAITANVRDGRLVRLRPGWFAVPSAPPDVAAAVRAGGRLSCVSALGLQGAWMMPDARLHVAISRGRPRPLGTGFRIHWADGPIPPGFPMDGPEAAIRQLIRCTDRRACIVALDSAVQLKIVSADAVAAILAETARGRQLARHLDPASESGTETLARLALRRLRLPVRTQVPIPDVGRVDLVIGDRLVLEVDGEKWHDRESTFEKDRARDRALVAAGYVVMRATYKQVMEGWGQVEGEILAVVRRNAHRWPSARR